jgi:hypothetical protein
MADVSRYSDISGHPDVAEIRERYERITASNQAIAIDGLVLLTGAWLAISPWVVQFALTASDVAANNFILGFVVTFVALGLTIAPTRMYRMSWALVAIGIWEVLSPWVIEGRAATGGVVVTNVITGVLTALMGLGAVALMTTARSDRTVAER